VAALREHSPTRTDAPNLVPGARNLEGVDNQVVNPYAPPTLDAEHDRQVPPEDGYYQLAELSQRWLGLFLDQLLLFVSAAPALIAVVAFDLEGVGVVLLSLVTVVPFAAYQYYLVARGQSLGKRIAKTRVVRLDGSPPGFLHGVVLRNWLFSAVTFVPGLGTIANLADVAMIFRADRRTVRDHVAGTRVIRS
jgi:uncharacterized RDD family membrane protein YckC